MSVIEAARIPPLPDEVSDRRSPGWWGMVLLILTEAVLFATFIAAYFYLAAINGRPWPPPGIEPPRLRLPIVMTVILLSSSAPLFWAEAGIHRGRQGQLRLGLLLSFLLGAAFLALQGLEYRRETIGLGTHAYSSLFFGITGFHGLHVLVGLTMNAYMQLRAWRGHFSAERYLAIQTSALYWHFVDAVWIVIFLSLYISPRLLR